MLIVVHSVSICQRANFIFKHLLVNAKMCVGIEIIISWGHFFRCDILVRSYNSTKYIYKAKIVKHVAHTAPGVPLQKTTLLTILNDGSRRSWGTLLCNIHSFHFWLNLLVKTSYFFNITWNFATPKSICQPQWIIHFIDISLFTSCYLYLQRIV